MVVTCSVFFWLRHGMCLKKIILLHPLSDDNFTYFLDSERPSNDENSEALIQIYYQQVDADCPSLNSENKRPLRIASLQFSSLDIIGE